MGVGEPFWQAQCSAPTSLETKLAPVLAIPRKCYWSAVNQEMEKARSEYIWLGKDDSNLHPSMNSRCPILNQRSVLAQPTRSKNRCVHVAYSTVRPTVTLWCICHTESRCGNRHTKYSLVTSIPPNTYLFWNI